MHLKRFDVRRLRAFGRAVSSNSRVFAVRFFGRACRDACLRPARGFAFAGAERIRPPRLRLFAFDSPRLICRRPMDSVGRNANLPHLSRPAYASERPARDRNTYNKIASRR